MSSSESQTATGRLTTAQTRISVSRRTARWDDGAVVVTHAPSAGVSATANRWCDKP